MSAAAPEPGLGQTGLNAAAGASRAPRIAGISTAIAHANHNLTEVVAAVLEIHLDGDPSVNGYTVTPVVASSVDV
jgi:hypothetical protein